jgi:hypothetical protein
LVGIASRAGRLATPTSCHRILVTSGLGPWRKRRPPASGAAFWGIAAVPRGKSANKSANAGQFELRRHCPALQLGAFQRWGRHRDRWRRDHDQRRADAASSRSTVDRRRSGASLPRYGQPGTAHPKRWPRRPPLSRKCHAVIVSSAAMLRCIPEKQSDCDRRHTSSRRQLAFWGRRLDHRRKTHS